MYNPHALFDGQTTEPVSFGKLSVGKLRRPESKRSMTTAPLRIGNEVARIRLAGEKSSDGIKSSDFEAGPKHSFGLKLSNPADEEALEKLVELLKDVPSDEEFQEWSPRTVLKDGILYIKCKPSRDGSRYQFESNISLTPGVESAELYQFMKVELIATVGCYFNVEDDGCGVYITPLYIEFVKDAPLGLGANKNPPNVDTRRRGRPTKSVTTQTPAQ